MLTTFIALMSSASPAEETGDGGSFLNLAIAIFSIIGGALLTALAGLFGAWIQSRREHEKWVREQRREAYDALLRRIAAYELAEQFRADGALANELWFEMQESTSSVSLVGPADVISAVEKLDPRGPDGSSTKLQLLAEMRKALHIDHRRG